MSSARSLHQIRREFVACMVRTGASGVRAVRTAKFVARKQWVVAGADDMYIRVYNHNTMEKIKSFEVHTDYIRRAAGCCHQGQGPPRMLLPLHMSAVHHTFPARWGQHAA